MRLFLNVPYEEKDEAKDLGAKWNPRVKKWYIDTKAGEYNNFLRWILGDMEEAVIAKDFIYIIEGERKCWMCRHLTKVIALGIGECSYIFRPEDNPQDVCIESYDNQNIQLHIGLVDEQDEIPPKLLKYLQKNYSVREDYSKTAGNCFANHCDHCGALQGNWYLFDEPDSPFTPWVDGYKLIRKLSKLKIKGIPIKDNLQLNWHINLDSDDYPYFEYAQFEELILSTDPKNECISYEELYDIK